MTSFVLDFSGWLKIDSKTIKFQRIVDDLLFPSIITGETYLTLPEKEKENYIIEDVIACLRDCDDNEWSHIDIAEIQND